MSRRSKRACLRLSHEKKIVHKGLSQTSSLDDATKQRVIKIVELELLYETFEIDVKFLFMKHAITHTNQ